MSKKGFTLVELLAVIAILAILVIVAMPNVLEMFNQAKINTFTTEVQTIIDKGISEFVSEALKNKGKELVFYNNTQETNSSKNSYNKLDMSGNEKNYYIKMNRNGEIEKIVVWDENYCYDSGNKVITKEQVQSSFVHEVSSTDGVTWDGTYIEGKYTNGTKFTIKGCRGSLNGILYGDANLDGKVTAPDMARINAYILNNVTFEDEVFIASDVNLDGTVNQADIDIIRMYILGNRGYDSLPVQE